MLLLNAVEGYSMDGIEDLQEQYLLKSERNLLFRNRDGFIISRIDIYVKCIVVIFRYSYIRRVFSYDLNSCMVEFRMVEFQHSLTCLKKAGKCLNFPGKSNSIRSACMYAATEGFIRRNRPIFSSTHSSI